MNRLLAAFALTALACTSDPPGLIGPPFNATFAVAGTVLDQAGTPVQGAGVFVVGTLGKTATGQDGKFLLHDLRGAITLWIEKAGIGAESRYLSVSSNLEVEITLVPGTPLEGIALGGSINGLVDASSDPCDRLGWDMFAPCTRYFLLAPRTGDLAIEVEWPAGGPELDATLVGQDGTYVGTSRPIATNKCRIDAPLTAGRLYQVRVNSYYESQSFVLRAELVP